MTVVRACSLSLAILAVTALPSAPQTAVPPDKQKKKEPPVDPLKKLGRQVELDGSKVRTVAGDFAVEIVADGLPVTPTLEEKSAQASVRLADGQKFQVWLANYTERSAAATLSIDGQSIFFACTLPRKPAAFLVPPAKDGKPGLYKVIGFFRDAEHSAAFQVTRKPKDRFGAIVAQFHFTYANQAELQKAEEGASKSPRQEYLVRWRPDSTLEVVPAILGRLQASIAVRSLPKRCASH